MTDFRRAAPLVLLAGLAACSLVVSSAGLDDGQCPSDMKDCGGKCVPNNLPQYGCAAQNCAPSALPQATATCGPTNVCEISGCTIGYVDCDQAQPGCETNKFLDTKNCGKCGTVCKLDNGTPGCAAPGVCVIYGCNAPYTNCNDFSEGCVNLSSDPEHCGSCTTACSVGQNCVPSSDAGDDGGVSVCR